VINKPYEKQYDASGQLVNPIEGSYKHFFPNRRERREKPTRVASNKSGTQLVVSRINIYQFTKYKKALQYLNKKRIVHYIDLKTT
jgi:hypothetical protein